MFEDLLDDADLEQMREDIKNAIDEAKDERDNNTSLSVFARFSMAGLKDFHEQYHRALSQSAHGNAPDLVKRYLTFGSSFFSFRWPPLLNVYGADMVMIVTFIPRPLIESVNAFLELHGTESHRRIEESLELLQKAVTKFEDTITAISEKRRADQDELIAPLQGRSSDFLKPNWSGIGRRSMASMAADTVGLDSTANWKCWSPRC